MRIKQAHRFLQQFFLEKRRTDGWLFDFQTRLFSVYKLLQKIIPTNRIILFATLFILLLTASEAHAGVLEPFHFLKTKIQAALYPLLEMPANSEQAEAAPILRIPKIVFPGDVKKEKGVSLVLKIPKIIFPEESESQTPDEGPRRYSSDDEQSFPPVPTLTRAEIEGRVSSLEEQLVQAQLTLKGNSNNQDTITKENRISDLITKVALLTDRVDGLDGGNPRPPPRISGTGLSSPLVLSQRIKLLNDVTITKSTITGSTIEGYLQSTYAADNYLSLSGGTITGDLYASTTLQATGNLLAYASLGIGSTTPARPLSVEGDAIITGNLRLGALTGTSTLAFTGTTGTSSLASRTAFTHAPTVAHTFSSWTTGAAGAHPLDASLVINPASATTDANLFGVAVNNAAYFLIDAEGDVFANSITTVGNTTLSSTTASTFQVENNTILGDAIGDRINIKAGDILHSNRATTTVLNLFPNVWSIATSTTNTPIFSISTASSRLGRVGIGTVRPRAALDVVGGILTTSSSTFSGLLNVNNLSASSTVRLTGLISTASSTIGADLFISDGLYATSTVQTGGHFRAYGTATSTFTGGLSLNHLTTTHALTIDGTGTSTFANGITLTNGCFRLPGGSCAGTGGGGWTDQGTYLDPTNNEGIIVSASSTFVGLLNVTGNFSASSTVRLTGFISTASSTIGNRLFVSEGIYATSTVQTGGHFRAYGTATSTFDGGLDITAGGIKIALPSCDSLDTDASGAIICGTDGGGTFAWTSETWGNSTSTVLGFLAGFISNAASSTVAGNLYVRGGELFASSTVSIQGNLASAAASLAFISDATTTIADNTLGSFNIGTTTAASNPPIFSITTLTNRKPTTTLQGTFRIDGGAFEYNSSSGETSVDALNVGPLSFEDNAGIVSWVDMPVSTTTAGVVMSYSAQIDGQPLLTLYGTTTTSGVAGDLFVGIGTTTPRGKLHIEDRKPTLWFTATTTSGIASSQNLFFSWQGGELYIGTSTNPGIKTASTTHYTFKNGDFAVRRGSICVDDDGTDCLANPGVGRLYSINATVLTDDIAELMRSREVLEPGDIVVPDPDFRNEEARTYEQERRSRELGVLKGLDEIGVKKTTRSQERAIIGIVSTKPGITLGGFEPAESDYEITLSGRVPVKVSTEGGPIEIGDYITSSSLAGVGMKALGSGEIVGVALEDFDGVGSPSATLEGGGEVLTGKILLLLNLGYRKLDPSIQDGALSPEAFGEGGWVIDQNSGKITTAYTLDMAGRDIVNVRNILGENWSIDEFGRLHVKEVHAKDKICIGETCVTEEQLKALLEGSSPPPASLPEDSSPEDISEGILNEDEPSSNEGEPDDGGEETAKPEEPVEEEEPPPEDPEQQSEEGTTATSTNL